MTSPKEAPDWLKKLIMPLKEWEARSNILYYATGGEATAEKEAEENYAVAWEKLQAAIAQHIAEQVEAERDRILLAYQQTTGKTTDPFIEALAKLRRSR